MAENAEEVVIDDGADASPENELIPAEAEVIEESEAESPTAVEKDDDEKSDKGILDRIDRLTRNWRSTERELAEEREQRKRIERMLEDAQKPAEDGKSKSLEDFDYDENAYRQYLITDIEGRATKKAETVAREIAQKAQDESRQERTQKAFQSKVQDFAKAHDDYFEVVEDRSLMISPTMASEIRESDIGPDIAYHLGKNPHIADEISQLPANAQIRRLALLESRLADAKSTASKKSVSGAPPPPPNSVKGVNAGSKVPASDPRSDSLSDDEWFKRRRAELARKHGD